MRVDKYLMKHVKGFGNYMNKVRSSKEVESSS